MTAPDLSPAFAVVDRALARSAAARRRPRPCTVCGAERARLYPSGWRCVEHAPLPLPPPPPGTTAAELREARARR